jgi:hypothetical protein
MEKLSPPVRIFALVAALAAVGGALFMFTMGGPPAPEPSALPVLSHADAVKAAAAKKAAAKAAPAKPKAVAKKTAAGKTPVASKPKAAPAKAAAAAPKPKPALNIPQEPTGLPLAIDRALSRHELVVVSLVLPGARVDELAAAEARAGAKLSGAGYLALNVLNEDVARSLLSKLGTLQDPSLLLVKRGGEVVLRLNGFVDRATVAQAAANASA